MTGICECGCGQRTRPAPCTDATKGWVKGRPLRYVHRHRPPPVRRGRENNRYNGGLSRATDGRWLIVCRDGTLMLYSRGVMVAHLGRLLRPSEIVHHRNEDPTDDRFANLVLTDRPGHIAMHRAALNAARGIGV